MVWGLRRRSAFRLALISLSLGLFSVLSVADPIEIDGISKNGNTTGNSTGNSTGKQGQQQSDPFPKGPSLELTVGSLCDTPTSYRYEEKIPYCERNVGSTTKKEIIMAYDRDLGFHVGEMNRQDFKIDHLIPLCAGGSNHVSNLWPQHKSVYGITDPLEPEICNKMAAGHLKQKDAVEIILYAKLHLEEVPVILARVKGL